MITLVKARLVHACYLANTLREIDRVECEALGRTPWEALKLGLKTSDEPLTVIDENRKPIAMFGVMPLSLVTGTGVPWFLGSDDVYGYPRDLMITGKGLFAYWLDSYRLLKNSVAVENDRAIRLLAYWGASFGEPEFHRGVEFIPFQLRAIQGERLAA